MSTWHDHTARPEGLSFVIMHAWPPSPNHAATWEVVGVGDAELVSGEAATEEEARAAAVLWCDIHRLAIKRLGVEAYAAAHRWWDLLPELHEGHQSQARATAIEDELAQILDSRRAML